MLEELKAALREDHGEHVKAEEYLNEAILWLEYIEELEQRYCQKIGSESDIFVLNDIITNYCTLVNWTAIVWFLKPQIKNSQVAEFLSQHFRWPRHISETFMNCIRNPSVHTGRSYIWGEHDANWSKNIEMHGSDRLFLGAFDPNIEARHLMPRKGAPHYNKARAIVYETGYFERLEDTALDAPRTNLVTFYLPAFKKLLVVTVHRTFDRIKGFDESQATQFDELRDKLTLTRVPAPENFG